MSYSGEKNIKVSVRGVGNTNRNLREILTRVVDEIGGEVGGHETACGATILKENEDEFIKLLKKNFEVEIIKI